MYLYYYFNEKYVGTVDIEVMWASNNSGSLIVTDEKGEALLGSLELMYGKHIERFTRANAYALKQGIPLRGSNKKFVLAEHIYTTSKVGPVLKWDDQRDTLCV